MFDGADEDEIAAELARAWLIDRAWDDIMERAWTWLKAQDFPLETLLDDADASTAQTTLGISAYIKTLLDDLDAATARATLLISADDSTYKTGDVKASIKTTADSGWLIGNGETIGNGASGADNAPGKVAWPW